MQIFDTRYKNKSVILALGAESAGNFSIYSNGKINYFSGFGDLLNDENFTKYNNSISFFIKKNKLKPNVIACDLHPLFKSTELGQVMSEKFNAKLIKVQHHFAHVFSVIGEHEINSNKLIKGSVVGVACDGTGFGLDEKIWGGEVFGVDLDNKEINRIGRLENQVLLGSGMAIREPARMLISILNNFLDKNEVYKYVDKYYSCNEYELLYNQLQKKFNCIETSSMGRVLDAASVLLGFAGNKLKYKHEPIDLLEQNSSEPYDISPVVEHDTSTSSAWVLKTTPLFEYLIKNIKKDKKRLAATAQLYLTKGIYQLIENEKRKIFFAGGMANNKIISEFLAKKGAVVNKVLERGDNALSFGQIVYYFKLI